MRIAPALEQVASCALWACPQPCMSPYFNFCHREMLRHILYFFSCPTLGLQTTPRNASSIHWRIFRSQDLGAVCACCYCVLLLPLRPRSRKCVWGWLWECTLTQVSASIIPLVSVLQYVFKLWNRSGQAPVQQLRGSFNSSFFPSRNFFLQQQEPSSHYM